MAQKIGILAADSVFIPIIIDNEGVIVSDAAEQATFLNQEVKQVFLVHLQVRKMSVTVYTSKEYGAEDARQPVNSDNDNEEMAVAEDQNESGSNNSDELGDDCDEFTIAQPTTASTTHEA